MKLYEAKQILNRAGFRLLKETLVEMPKTLDIPQKYEYNDSTDWSEGWEETFGDEYFGGDKTEEQEQMSKKFKAFETACAQEIEDLGGKFIKDISVGPSFELDGATFDFGWLYDTESGEILIEFMVRGDDDTIYSRLATSDPTDIKSIVEIQKPIIKKVFG